MFHHSQDRICTESFLFYDILPRLKEGKGDYGMGDVHTSKMCDLAPEGWDGNFAKTWQPWSMGLVFL